MNLVCIKCNKNSIPAPPGTTEKTRYVCRECSPLGPEDVHFDASQFAPGMLPLHKYGPEAAYRAAGLRVMNPPADNSVVVEVIRRRIENGEDIFLPAAIQRAVENGDAWAKAVNAKSLLMLSPRLFEAFTWFYWADMSHAQIASEMNVSEQVSRNFILRAKTRLEEAARC